MFACYRMDVHLSNGTDFIENQRKAKKKVEDTLRLDPAVPLNLDVKLNVAPLKGTTEQFLKQFFIEKKMTHVNCVLQYPRCGKHYIMVKRLNCFCSDVSILELQFVSVNQTIPSVLLRSD